MKKILVALVMMLFVVGCTTLKNVSSNDILVQYSTMKLIEQSDDINAQDVLDAVQDAREVVSNVDTQLDLSALREQARVELGIDKLDTSDQLLIKAVIDQIEKDYLAQVETDLLTPEAKVSIEEFLILVEQAALMSR